MNGLSVMLSGTSNSIFFGGLSEGISSNTNVDNFQNYSLGASGVVAIPYHLTKIDFSSFDLAFFDYSINENEFIGAGATELSCSLNHVAEAISASASKNCIPILLNIPAKMGYIRGNAFWTAMKDTFEPQGVLCIDVAKELELYSIEQNVPIDMLFADELHLRRDIARYVGGRVVDFAINAYSTSARPILPIKSSFSFRQSSFHYAQRQSNGTFPDVTRKNSLLTESMAVISEQDTFYLPILEFGDLILTGLIYNAAKSSGNVVDAQGTLLLTVEIIDEKLNGRDLIIKAIPTPTSSMRLADIGALRVTPQEGGNTAVLELVGLVMSNPSQDCWMQVSGTQMVRHLETRLLESKHFCAIDAILFGAPQSVAMQVAHSEGVSSFKPGPLHLRRGVPDIIKAGSAWLQDTLEREGRWRAHYGEKIANDRPVDVTLFCGQSTGAWTVSGGPKGLAWSARLQFAGHNMNPNFLMLNGGILRPGIGDGMKVIDQLQETFVPAVDELSSPGEELDEMAATTGRTIFRHSTSAAIAYMIQRTFPFGGEAAESDRLCASICIGGKGIDFFLPEVGQWFNNIFRPTLVNTRNAARDRKLRVTELIFEQGESDSQTHRAAEYAEKLDRLVCAFASAANELTGDTNDQVVIAQPQFGTPLLSNGSAHVGRPARQICDVSLAILQKGISDAPADQSYICLGPRYDLSFSSINHLDHFGYIHSEERHGFIMAEQALRMANVEDSEAPVRQPLKWKPTHVVSVKYKDGPEGHCIEVHCHVPFRPLVLDTDLVPAKAGFGFSLHGSDDPPEIVNCQIGPSGTTILLSLSRPWLGEGRVLGVAVQASLGRQGWLTKGETPGGAWQHVGVGANVRDSAPWVSAVTGIPLQNWICSQFIVVD